MGDLRDTLYDRSVTVRSVTMLLRGLVSPVSWLPERGERGRVRRASDSKHDRYPVPVLVMLGSGPGRLHELELGLCRRILSRAHARRRDVEHYLAGLSGRVVITLVDGE